MPGSTMAHRCASTGRRPCSASTIPTSFASCSASAPPNTPNLKPPATSVLITPPASPDPVGVPAVFALARATIREAGLSPEFTATLGRLLDQGQVDAEAMEVYAPVELSAGVYA